MLVEYRGLNNKDVEGRLGIYAPRSDEPDQVEAINNLRSQGEIVICELAGQDAAAKDMAIQQLMTQVANLTAMLGPSHGFAEPPNESTGTMPNENEAIPQEGTGNNDVQRQPHPLRANEQSGEAFAASHLKEDNGQDSGATTAGVGPNPG